MLAILHQVLRRTLDLALQSLSTAVGGRENEEYLPWWPQTAQLEGWSLPASEWKIAAFESFLLCTSLFGK